MLLIKDANSTQDVTVKFIHCDNAGENKAFDELCKQGDMVMNFDCTVPGMLQKMVELSIY